MVIIEALLLTILEAGGAEINYYYHLQIRLHEHKKSVR